MGLGLLPVCIHSFSALRCSIPSGSVCLRCVGGDDDHDHHHRRTQKAAIIAFGKAMRAEATIPPFPSLGKGRGDGWPSRHQRRSCRSTLMAASPQPSLAPMKAGVASPLPSPSPSLADANSGKVGRRDLRPGRHQTHAEHKGRGDEAEAGRADVVAAAADPRRRRSTSRSPSALTWRSLARIGTPKQVRMKEFMAGRHVDNEWTRMKYLGSQDPRVLRHQIPNRRGEHPVRIARMSAIGAGIHAIRAGHHLCD